VIGIWDSTPLNLNSSLLYFNLYSLRRRGRRTDSEVNDSKHIPERAEEERQNTYVRERLWVCCVSASFGSEGRNRTRGACWWYLLISPTDGNLGASSSICHVTHPNTKYAILSQPQPSSKSGVCHYLDQTVLLPDVKPKNVTLNSHYLKWNLSTALLKEIKPYCDNCTRVCHKTYYFHSVTA
jgi:hypothetical protein